MSHNIMIDIETLQTGDLLLFDGESILSKAIKFFTASCWSHVALVYRCPKTQTVYAFENGNVPKGSGPVITRKGCPRNSVHLVPLESSTRMQRYRGLIYLRRLKCNKPIDQDKLSTFIADNLGTDYSWDLVPSWNQRGGTSLLPLSFLEEKMDGSSGWICSQLVALTYEHLGVMDLLQPSQTYMPVDFSKKDDIVNNENYILLEPELLYCSIEIHV